MTTVERGAALAELHDLLERVGLMLRVDQQRPIDQAVADSIARAVPADMTPLMLSVQDRISVGNFYYSVNEPLKALEYYWSAAHDEKADQALATVARNNASVVYLMFCPGFVAEQILSGMFGPVEITHG